MENNNTLPNSETKEKLNEKQEIFSDCSLIANSNVSIEDSNQGLALEFLNVVFKYGELSFAFSYKVKSFISLYGKLQYYTIKHFAQGVIGGIVYSLVCINLLAWVIKYDFNISYSLLVNGIKRMVYTLFALKLIITYICLEARGRNQGLWPEILKQADVIQQAFSRLGINLPSVAKVKKLGRAICVFSVLLCIVHVMAFLFGGCIDHTTAWYAKSVKKILSAVTLYSVEFDVKEVPPVIGQAIGVLGVIFQLLCWNMWYFVDALRVFACLVVWIIFRKLNHALTSEKLQIENFPDVIYNFVNNRNYLLSESKAEDNANNFYFKKILDLYFNGVKLLNLFNKMLGPITLSSSVFNILYACFWTNYSLLSFEFKLIHVVGIITILRMVFVFYITADVNTQAYQISTWVENNFVELDKKGVKVDRMKMSLFSSLIYSRDAVGFKGLNFFTITPAFNITIIGLVLTYTVVVNQVATH